MKMVKYPCIYCHKSTGCTSKSSAGSKGALQCGVCELWAHYDCTGLGKGTLDAFEVLINSGDCDRPFKCQSCKAALNKFNADLNAMKMRMNSIETKQQETVKKNDTLEAQQAGTSAQLQELESKVECLSAASNSSKEVWDELKEREREESLI